MVDWFHNGDAVKNLSIDDRGLQYGDGLFETVAIRDGEPRLWQLHIDRLHKGCSTLNFALPPPDDLTKGLRQALSASSVGADHAIVKLIATAGVGNGKRGYGRSETNAKIYFGVFESKPLDRAAYRDGVATTLCNTRLASCSPTAGLKTLCRTEQVLARSEFIASGEFEGFTMDAEDGLICGTMSNVFFVHNKSVSTPAVDSSGVAGVMRRHVMACLGAAGRPVLISKTTRTDLAQIDEVFISNSQLGIVPVARCDTMHWGVGSVTRDVMAVMAENGIAECRG